MFISRFKWTLSTRHVFTNARNPYTVDRLVNLLKQMPSKDASSSGLVDIKLAERKAQKRLLKNIEDCTVEELVTHAHGPQATRRIASMFLSKLMILSSPQDATLMIAFFLRINGLKAAETVVNTSQFLQLDLPNSVLAMFIRSLYKIKGGRCRKLVSKANSSVNSSVNSRFQLDETTNMAIDGIAKSEIEMYTSIYMSLLFNLLKSFRSRGFKANRLVWNAVLTALPSIEAKVAFYREMQQLGIEPIEYFMNDIIPSVADVVLNASESKLIEQGSNPFPMLYSVADSDSLYELLVYRRLKLHGLNGIIKTLQIALERPTPKMQFLFLEFFASMHRIDYQFGVLDLFNVPLDAPAYECMLKAAAYSKSRADKGLSSLSNRVELICTIVEQMWRENLILTQKGRVIARRAIKRFKELNTVPREYGPHGWALLRQGLCWQMPPRISPPSTSTPPSASTDDRLFSLLLNDGGTPPTKQSLPNPADPSLLRAIGCSRAGTELPYYSVSNGFKAIGNCIPSA